MTRDVFVLVNSLTAIRFFYLVDVNIVAFHFFKVINATTFTIIHGEHTIRCISPVDFRYFDKRAFFQNIRKFFRISAFIYEIQFDGQILSRFFCKPYHFEFGEDEMHQIDKKLELKELIKLW